MDQNEGDCIGRREKRTAPRARSFLFLRRPAFPRVPIGVETSGRTEAYTVFLAVWAPYSSPSLYHIVDPAPRPVVEFGAFIVTIARTARTLGHGFVSHQRGCRTPENMTGVLSNHLK
jgi:hypothetical protein